MNVDISATSRCVINVTTLRQYSRNPLNRAHGAIASRTLAKAHARRLDSEAKNSKSSILGNSDVDVSLTSHGVRTASVHIAIQSIASGDCKPKSLTLWLDTDPETWTPSPGLSALMRRGLRVQFTENYGPHTKYFPHCIDPDRSPRSLATADDDIIYPRDWLSSLLESAARDDVPSIVAHRAHHIEFTAEGLIAEYMSWTRRSGARPSPRVFATGVSGVLYPPKMLDHLQDAGDAFRTVTPRADDIWLHAVALRASIPVRQALARPRDFLSVPSTQRGGLGVTNALRSGNDDQIRRTYTAADVLRMRDDA